MMNRFCENIEQLFQQLSSAKVLGMPNVLLFPISLIWHYINIRLEIKVIFERHSTQRAVMKQVVEIYLNFGVIIALCEDRWTFHDNKCFFVGRAANRVQAQQICQNMNSSLAVIRSLAQLYFMTTLEITSNTWIGLTDSEQDGSWKWNNGDVAMITDWGLNQPDGGVLENCAAMNVSDTYKWHDEPCSAINDYFCEKGKVILNFIFNSSSDTDHCLFKYSILFLQQKW